jgi:hypothetical protein
MSLTVFVNLQHVPPRKTDSVPVPALPHRRDEHCANKHSAFANTGEAPAEALI